LFACSSMLCFVLRMCEKGIREDEMNETFFVQQCMKYFVYTVHILFIYVTA